MHASKLTNNFDLGYLSRSIKDLYLESLIPHTMKIKMFLIACFLMIVALHTQAQGFQPPAEGKAVVYFVRVSTMGFAISFEYFDGDKYIGAFKGKNYMRYECEAGQHLLWASSENKEFITADLKAGGTYVVIVDIAMGIGKARVGLNPITAQPAELFARAKELVKAEPAQVTPQEKIDKMNIKLKDFIAEKLDKYETVWKKEKTFPTISPEQAVAEADLQ